MTIHDDLREVMGLLGRATPGEWTVGRFGSVHRPKSEGSESSVGAAIVAGGSKSGMYDGYQENCEAIAAAVNFLRQHGPALLAAAKYEEANPLGGPATMLEAAARRIRAGEDFHEVLADYGLLARQEGEDARDAARYQWLKANFQADYCRSTSDYWRITGEHETPQELHIGNGELTLDYLVDAARSGGGG